MKVVILISALLAASAVHAEGGKQRAGNPVLLDGCSTVAPGVIDKGDCETIPASDQSGVQVLICDAVVICPEADTGDDD